MGKYFGTDGVRGLANDKLTPELAFKLGRAGAAVLLEGHAGERPVIFIGRDTRRSGTMLEAALAAGICSVGVDVYRLGVVPTPVVAWLAANCGGAAGVMISASHNPSPDNGIKFFSGDGFKLPDETEGAIEVLLDAVEDTLPRPTGEALGVVEDRFDLVENYVRHVTQAFAEGLTGLSLVLDVGHGAAYALAPRVLRALGAHVQVLNDAPDGDNINRGCGSTHLEQLQARVREGGFQLGIAFDGDADRMLAVDETGAVVDGDHIMLICLEHALATGRLKSPSLVATVMSNMGFEEAVQRLGGELVRAKVGDRYVLEEMKARDIRIGGEQSGHLIFLDDNTTGDGLNSALRLLSALKAAGEPLSVLAAKMTDYPQVLKNVRLASTQGWQQNPAIAKAIADADAELAGSGRLLVRASGTEPLIRVMVEGKDDAQIHGICDRLIGVISSELA
ncbi:MAG TPA: phosphoglucosamine mutase [Pantanalinema sp.]